MNNTLEGINSWITEAEEKMSDLEDKMVEINATKHNIEKRMKKKKMKTASENLWNNINHTKIHIIGVPEGEERGKGPQKIFEAIIAENFLNMGKEIVNWIQERQSPKQDKPKVKHIVTHSNQTDKK